MADRESQINERIHRLKQNLSSLKSCLTACEESLYEVIRDFIALKEEKLNLIEENEGLVFENESLKEEKVMFRTEIEDLRIENDLLISKLTERDLIKEKALEFAKNVLNNGNGLQSIVNSLPSFSEQIVLSDRPNSVNALSSISDLNGMRLTQSKENEVIESHQNSSETTTSEGTYYDATSQRSSITNACASVRPKVCQQNQVSSTINSCPNSGTDPKVLNESQGSYTFDENNNLKLKLIKVPIGKVMPISIAYITSPSNFWLHINSREVNDYIHVIQVKQQEMAKCANTKLTSADIKLGMYCAAIYSSDGYWYRAQVVNINYGNDSIKSVEVLFIDWGNKEVLPLSKVMKLSNELTKHKQAVNCYLQGFDLGTHRWPQKSVDEFKDVVEKQKLRASFSRAQQVSEVLDSLLYPVDIIILFENGTQENLSNYLPVPEFVDEQENEVKNLIEFDNESTVTPETIVCDSTVNHVSNEAFSEMQTSSSKPNSNETRNGSVSPSVPNYSNCNGKTCAPLNQPKIVSHSVLQSSINSNINLQIPPPIVPDTCEGLIVQLSSIVSPSEFFVHINDPQVGIAQLDDLDEQLFTYYSKYVPSVETQVFHVTTGSFWSCQFSQDQRWYRVRVLRVIDNQALVSYVDYGNEEEVEIKDLMPLTLRFSTCPALAVKCSLSGVSPNGSNDWSEESVIYFTDLTGFQQECILTAYIGHKSSSFSFDSKLELFLWANDSKEPTAKDILINSKLVIQKYAITDNIEWVESAERDSRERTPPEVKQLIEIAYGRTPNVNSSNNLNGQMNVRYLPELSCGSSQDDDWDPMADDAYCDTNNYNIIPDDPSTVTLGYHTNDMKTCKYFGTAKGCRLKDCCPFLHVNPNQRFALVDAEEEPLYFSDIELEVGSTVLFKVTGIQSPFSFFGILPFGSQTMSDSDVRKALNSEQIDFSDFKSLCTQLKTHYSNCERKENPNVFHAIGSLVAYKDEKHDNYFRGRIMKNEFESNCCTVFNVDLGHTLVVKRALIYKLEKFFTEIPTFAIHCSLFGIEPLITNCERTAVWSDQAIKAFTELTLDKVFCAHILSGKYDNKISVELIDCSNDEKECITEKLVSLNVARMLTNKQSDDEIYCSDID